MNPAFVATVELYPSDNGGRQTPIVGEWFSCPCKFQREDHDAWDCRILLKGARLAPGETAQFEMIFLSPEAGERFAAVPHFYLWEGGIIGEAKLLK